MLKKYITNHRNFLWYGALAIVFCVGVALRLYHITYPVADWHSWRQADTAAVARNFLKFGFDPLRPRYDDLSNIQSGKDNPKGYRMVEFPLYQFIAAGLEKLVPQLSIEIWLRLVSIAASSLTGVFLILIVSMWTDTATGLVAGLLFAVLPYSVYYGRTILPDVFAVFWSIASLLMLSYARITQKHKTIFFLSSICFGALALLSKPVAVFLLLPAIVLFFHNQSIMDAVSDGLLYWFFVIIPVIAWRQWILQFPEGIPVFAWLFNEGNIRFKGAWFYWLFAKRIGELILGFWGLIPFGVGIALAGKKMEAWFFRSWIIGALAYMVVIARGNVQHDYYQILIIPVLCVYFAKGFVALMRLQIFSKAMSISLAIVSFLFMISFSWYTIRTYYWINRQEIVEAGKMADSILPKNAKVIASYNGDTTFLYQINRQGWPLGFDIDQKILMGATHYVTVSPTDNDGETRALASRFTVLVRNDKYAIIDLTKPRE